MSDFDHEYTTEVVCPYCGHAHRDSWELDDAGEIDCASCERQFRYIRDVTVTYSTEPIGDTDSDS